MKTITLAFIGDVMLGRGVNMEISHRAPESFWGTTLPILRSADGVIANLECCITATTERWSETPKVFYFRADPKAVEVLKAANIRCATLANNHTLDYGHQGLLDTLDALHAGGIITVGAGRNLEEARAPAIFDVGGIRIGIAAFTDNEPPFAARPDSPGTNYLEIDPGPVGLRPVEESRISARRQGAELFILALHWGPNMVIRPPGRFRAFGAAALALHTDIIYGHSAHLFQGIQRRDSKVILYDTGDFLDDYAVDPELRNDWSFIFLVEADSQGLIRLRLLPVRLHYARVDLAEGEEFEQICKRMESLCAEFGTATIRTPEGLEIPLRP